MREFHEECELAERTHEQTARWAPPQNFTCVVCGDFIREDEKAISAYRQHGAGCGLRHTNCFRPRGVR